MKTQVAILSLITILSCNKVVEVSLPAYDSELTVEMYLQHGEPLRCLLTQSLPYTDTAINRLVDDALVIFSDGVRKDTLYNTRIADWENGRWYNYAHHRVIFADTAKTYTLTIADKHGRKISGATRFSQRVVKIDKIDVRPMENSVDSFSVGMSINDDPALGNYYRFMIIKKKNDFTSDPTDFSVADDSFNGKPFSFYSESGYARNDTVLVRAYSLLKEHYDYIHSAEEARTSNFNPFAQSSRILSTVEGGLGIFTAIRFDERQVVIR